MPAKRTNTRSDSKQSYESTKPKKPAKPKKPYKSPLTVHPSGTWCKRIKGRLYHFGRWDRPDGIGHDAALEKYLKHAASLHAGKGMEPEEEKEPVEPVPQITMADLANEFLEAKEKLVETGDLSAGTWQEYKSACVRLLEITGRQRIVESLRPSDFDDIRVKLAKGVGKVTLANRIRQARILFKFANDQDLIPHPLKFGQSFKQPDRATMRAEKNARGPKDFSADELRKIIEAAGVQLKAMILLGINCGFGNVDCASLPRSAINLDSGWLNFPRPKTAVERRCPLWPETVKALRDALAICPIPKDEADSGLVFITKYGKPFVRIQKKKKASSGDDDRIVKLDAVSGEFGKLLVSLNLNGRRRAFYSLRRTFETVAGDSLDQVATSFIMGHAAKSDDMSAVYRQRISDVRLSAVTNHVRAWLGYPLESAGTV